MTQYKVLVVQPISSSGMEVLKNANVEIIQPESTKDEVLEEIVVDCDAILVRTKVISRSLIEKAKKLKVIARSGVGYDNIDIIAAAEKGIYVCNVPRVNSNAVAEHVVGMIIALSRNILKADKALRKNHFEVREYFIGNELTDKTIGLIGYGNIGQLTAKKCALGLDMNVIVYDPYIQNERSLENVVFVDSVDTILEQSDFVSLHLPYTSELHHIIGEKELQKMKSTASLINCARGGLVDEKALYKAIKYNEIRGAGIDVFENEPPEDNYTLWNLENIIVTPHMAAHTKESLGQMASGTAKEIINVLQEKEPVNCVNKHLFSSIQNI